MLLTVHSRVEVVPDLYGWVNWKNIRGSGIGYSILQCWHVSMDYFPPIVTCAGMTKKKHASVQVVWVQVVRVPQSLSVLLVYCPC